MSLTLGLIGLGLGLALIFPLIRPDRRGAFLFWTSLLALFWLQPPLPIRWSGFILPAATVGLTVIFWWLTRPAGRVAPAREDWITLGWIFLAILLLGLVRYLPPDWRPTLNRPPSLPLIAAGLLLAGGGFWGLARAGRRPPLMAGAIFILLVFIALKSPPLTAALSAVWRLGAGQNPELARPADLAWLGFSYIAFRLLHTLRDRQTGQLPDLTLRGYLTYIIFFPSLLAGPIDRAERFSSDYEALVALQVGDPGRWFDGLTRIGSGLFKKFILADSLALGFALDPVNAAQVDSTGWLWLLLYGYGLRLYLDFAGYSDIAIGLGLLFGIRLPENFDFPYARTDIASFWKSWHISLSDWARFYIFTPLSRALLRRKPRPAPSLIVLLGHLATMLAIALWHGITANFFIWGLWHAAGLFAHKQWSDRTRALYRRVQTIPWQRRVWKGAGWLITFHFVLLGWVWFLLPDLPAALRTFRLLLGGA